MINVINGSVLEFDYKNWRGETSKRLVLVEGLSYGSTEYHAFKAQFFLSGFCFDKRARRTFALSDIIVESIVRVA